MSNIKKGIFFLFFTLLFYTSQTEAAENKIVLLGNIEFSNIKEKPHNDFELRLFFRGEGDLFNHLTKERSYEAIKENDYITIKNRAYSFPQKTGYSNVEPSFIIDFNAKPFRQIREEIIKIYGESPSPQELTLYVNNYIINKNFNRGFDIASVIADKREGDCTEHAILLVSLMRMFKIPARMVMGIKVFTEGKNTLAYGHAWVEYITKGKWQGADPALLDEVDHSYIPMGVLEREGLDYAMGMITLFNRLPYRIEGWGL